MEIKKADSEGRVSGFEPGEYYWFAKLSPLESALAEDLEWMEARGTAEEAEMLLNQAMAKKNGMVN